MPKRKLPVGTPISFVGEDDAFTVVTDLGDVGIVLRDQSGDAFLSPRSCVTAQTVYIYSAPEVDKPPTSDVSPSEG
ncbi:hypothetical protein SDC9_85670 [bioreactor metagenome]|uniref:Uncharacterized protein n=1 Tax=bioreactor metagenome TaxID=1076179 RepID=A0A644ZE58_9ZZZZ